MNKQEAISNAQSIIQTKLMNWPNDEWVSIDADYDLSLSTDFFGHKVATLYGIDENGNPICESITV